MPSLSMVWLVNFSSPPLVVTKIGLVEGSIVQTVFTSFSTNKLALICKFWMFWLVIMIENLFLVFSYEQLSSFKRSQLVTSRRLSWEISCAISYSLYSSLTGKRERISFEARPCSMGRTGS